MISVSNLNFGLILSLSHNLWRGRARTIQKRLKSLTGERSGTRITNGITSRTFIGITLDRSRKDTRK